MTIETDAATTEIVVLEARIADPRTAEHLLVADLGMTKDAQVERSRSSTQS
jgi:hypothetical protein